MNHVYINLECHLLTEHATWGSWCEHCFKPSVVKAPSVIVNKATLGVIDRSILCVCQDCRRHHYEPTVTHGTTCDDA